MENSINEPEVQRSFTSPPRRRRSTFFIRRDSIVPPLINNEDGNTVNINAEDTKPFIDMECYYEKLLSEKDQWKKEVKERRNKYHDLREQYQIAAKSSSRTSMSYSTLSNEDIQFLKGKPNISKFIGVQQKLHKSVKETMAFIRRTQELDDIVLSSSENKVNAITGYIFDNSSVEPNTVTNVAP